MTAATSLFRASIEPMIVTDTGLVDDTRYYVVARLGDGTVLVHGSTDAPVPEDALLVYYDGSRPWTWGAFAAKHRAIAAAIMPHEWAGEPTARDVHMTDYPKLIPVAVEREPGMSFG